MVSLLHWHTHVVTRSGLLLCQVVLHAVFHSGVLPCGEIFDSVHIILSRELHVSTTQGDPYVLLAILKSGTFTTKPKSQSNLSTRISFTEPNMQPCGNKGTHLESRSLHGLRYSRHGGNGWFVLRVRFRPCDDVSIQVDSARVHSKSP